MCKICVPIFQTIASHPEFSSNTKISLKLGYFLYDRTQFRVYYFGSKLIFPCQLTYFLRSTDLFFPSQFNSQILDFDDVPFLNNLLNILTILKRYYWTLLIRCYYLSWGKGVFVFMYKCQRGGVQKIANFEWSHLLYCP